MTHKFAPRLPEKGGNYTLDRGNSPGWPMLHDKKEKHLGSRDIEKDCLRMLAEPQATARIQHTPASSAARPSYRRSTTSGRQAARQEQSPGGLPRLCPYLAGTHKNLNEDPHSSSQRHHCSIKSKGQEGGGWQGKKSSPLICLQAPTLNISTDWAKHKGWEGMPHSQHGRRVGAATPTSSKIYFRGRHVSRSQRHRNWLIKRTS